MLILLFQIEYGPGIEPLSVRTYGFIFLTMELTIFKLFRLTLEQIVNWLYMPLGCLGFIFHR
jgi:hypothetical protein